jgi:hypothetical protein
MSSASAAAATTNYQIFDIGGTRGRCPRTFGSGICKGYQMVGFTVVQNYLFGIMRAFYAGRWIGLCEGLRCKCSRQNQTEQSVNGTFFHNLRIQ